ncbi:hypothetical protein CEUSTIGMA_g10591.t1 [Chlamydomonas eustigma]|uniref:Uncharacterized protein n=1 Tax=Chlamydomonas eustigma TaxID=1157962 RepID=A0A250XJA6_9CHLO|nr:hypothetical protein CEUSTIGMA_g10591.t1 [Chlamydomonas eustigma]|eukprot:GAX83165.1 hypothetical protein CEUSTIGMA_g10591.t1 [Chlamydomonas eustigma]
MKAYAERCIPALAKGERDKDPFWCRPWPSGLALADHILRNPSLVKGKRVIELGAGVGSPGIAAALSGAYEVVVTDREPLALRCAALSAQASGVLQPASIVTGSGLKQDALSFALESSSQPSMEVTRCVPTGSETLSFGNHDPCAQLPGAPVSLQLFRSVVRETEAVIEGKDVVSSPGQHKQLFSCELLDWSQPVPEHLLGRFDLILATDVLYEHFSVPMLARVVSALSARAGQGNTANVLGPDLSGEMGEPSVTRVPNLVQTTTQDEGRGVSKLLLVEYPDRYPSNLRNMQTLLQEPAVNLHLEGILDYETALPCFTNEMLDIDVGSPLHPVIRTHFITFTETIPS